MSLTLLFLSMPQYARGPLVGSALTHAPGRACVVAHARLGTGRLFSLVHMVAVVLR